MAKPIKIAKLRHRVALCSQKDVIEEGTLRLNRQGVLEVWAMIEVRAAQTFGVTGAAISEREKRSHVITMRYLQDIEISNLAWLYERRLKSSPRWFKILKSSQTEIAGSPYYKFDVRLVERSDAAAAPTEASGPAKAMPHGVKF